MFMELFNTHDILLSHASSPNDQNKAGKKKNQTSDEVRAA